MVVAVAAVLKVCVAPATATPALLVVIFCEAKPLVPVKLKVPVPP